MEKAAKRFELPLPVARDIRVQAMNLILGRCVLCRKYTLAGMCAHCRKTALHRRRIPWSGIKLLTMLNPSDQLLRQVCNQCRRPFMLSAGYLLRKLLSRNSEDTKNTCNRCLEEEKEAKKRKLEEVERQKFELKKKVIEERRKRQAEVDRRKQEAKDREAERRPKLVYQPFAGNKTLAKLKNELKRASPLHKPYKGPKRA